jgi:hypothetical protein
MPSKRRRKPGTAVRRGAPASAGVGAPPPDWKWLTFPVYFALSSGLFIGYNVGALAKPNSRLMEVGNYLFAIMFSFGLAQFVTRPLTQMMLRRRAQRESRKLREQRG